MESITLQTGDNIITSGDILGKLQFAASAEGDAVGRLLSASLYAQAESAFTSAGNATSLVFSTSSNDTNPTVARLKVGPDGDFLPVVDATYDIGASSLRFQDAYFSGGVFLSDATPPVTTNKLYNSGGSLYFNGSAVGGGGSYTAGSGLMLVGDEFNVYGGSGHFQYIKIDSDLPGKIDFGGTREITALSSSRLSIYAGNGGPATIVNGGVLATSAGFLGFTNGTSALSNADCLIYRDGANTFAQRRGANAQTFRVYNTYTSSTSYERAKLEWSSNVLNIGTEFGSAGGSARPLSIQTSGTDRMRFDTDGDVGIGITSPDAQFHIVNDNASDTAIIIKGAVSQSANLQEWQDSSSQVLSQINSDGTLTTDGVILSEDTPSVTTNKLYNTGGTLYFNGSSVGGGGSTYTAGSGITIDASDSIHVFGGTGNFRSISMTNHTPSPNTAQLYWDGTDIRFAGTKLTQISNPNASMVNKIPYFNSTSAITWDSSLSWDATNNRLGIGTDSPQREIHIAGSDTWGRLDRNNNSYGAAFLMTRGNTSAVVQQSWLFGLPNIAGLSTGADHFVIVDFGTAVGGTTGDVRLLVDKTTGSVGIGEISVDAQLHVKSNSSTKIGSIVQGAASQSVNLQEWQDSSQTTLSSMSSAGIIEARGYKTNSNMIITESGTTRTLSASDNGKIIRCTSGSATTITVPTGLDVGFSVTVIQGGLGQVTFSASGTNIRNRQSHTKTAGTYAIVSLIQLATNEFYLAGDTGS
jgi:hypothetical protein